MFGIRFIKVAPTDFVLQYSRGQLIREGIGLSFFYFAPTTSLVLVPVGSVDMPFIFEEVTADFQQVTIQGQLTYRVIDAKKLASLMDFSLSPDGKGYQSDDPNKLPQRLINQVQVLTRATLKTLPLRRVLGLADELLLAVQEGLEQSPLIASLGIEVLGLSILAIKPTPETARALEAEAREQILLEADEAIYSRRNAAVEQERAIRENELNTEIAVENKQRQIRETQMEAERSIQQKTWQLKQEEMVAKIALEAQNKDYIALATANARQEADSQAYAIAVAMKAFAESDAQTIQALASANMQPKQLIALAFKELANSADKIGQLNMSPDLLRELLTLQDNQQANWHNS
ncbi:MAG: SPFH domain-containing protein [Deinococcales bacterium]